MSDSDGEEFPLLGTPLESFEEGDIPSKKPVPIQDQIATDKYGRRRFHGAFTGGFSAGHFNSVGTPEGWTPSSFKSSRTSKIEKKTFQPQDFMDDEDVEDFGIAPSVLRAKAEYSGTRAAKKRDRIKFQDGPIPGEPVLQRILEPAKDTVGVLLLMKMGWKPGQGIGPRLNKLEKRRQKRKMKQERSRLDAPKIYGCAPKAPSSEESEESDEELDLDTLFAPDDAEVAFTKPKSDLFGMGYSGLSRDSVLSGKYSNSSASNTFRMLDNNKKLAIKGQAFGVGAFEEEDADIYARDDMSQYDFSLETPGSLKEKRRQERAGKLQLLAIGGTENTIEGFVAAKNKSVPKKYFPPPTLPPGFEPRHVVRKSRFGPEKTNLPEVTGKKHVMDVEDRSVILGEKSTFKPAEQKNEEENPIEPAIPDLPPPEPLDGTNFRPFLADPPKQARYEKYLQLIKIGAKDAFRSMQPKHMSEWERERERTEFEQAAKLYRPLSGMMADRFARAELPDESNDPLAPVAKMHSGQSAEIIAAAASKMFGKLTRTVVEWVPVSLLCKRMNVPEPVNSGGKSLCEIAKENKQAKSKFSVFDILANSDNPFKAFEETKSEKEKETPKESEENTKNNPEDIHEDIADGLGQIKFDDPAEKKDLFKAIFCDSDDEEEEEPQEKPPTIIPTALTEAAKMNILRNTSPPRGIFANLNLDKLQPPKPPNEPQDLPTPNKNLENTQLQPSTSKSQPQNTVQLDNTDTYGPALPSRPIFIHKHKIPEKLPSSSSDSSPSSSSDDERWIEKESKDSRKKHKKTKKSKDRKKEKKRKKSKKHKDHKRKHKDKKDSKK